MLNFTAIDFETANFERASACAVGVAVVRDSVVVRQKAILIYPPTGLDFTNSHIHGLTADHVLEAPRWEDAAAQLLELAAGSPLVTYSPFDKGVWNAAWKHVEQPAPLAQFLDALALTKAHLQLDGYKLPRVARELGLTEFAHHEAGADALACAQIVLALSERTGLPDVASLWDPVLNRRRRARSYTDFAAKKGADKIEVNTDADPAHPLYGETVCFSGDLDNYSRAEAQKLCAALGANVSTGVTKKTTLVVMGGFDPATLKPGATVSSKVRKAQDLASSGQRIEIVPESTFLELLEFTL